MGVRADRSPLAMRSAVEAIASTRCRMRKLRTRPAARPATATMPTAAVKPYMIARSNRRRLDRSRPTTSTDPSGSAAPTTFRVTAAGRLSFTRRQSALAKPGWNSAMSPASGSPDAENRP